MILQNAIVRQHEKAQKSQSVLENALGAVSQETCLVGYVGASCESLFNEEIQEGSLGAFFLCFSFMIFRIF